MISEDVEVLGYSDTGLTPNGKAALANEKLAAQARIARGRALLMPEDEEGDVG